LVLCNTTVQFPDRQLWVARIDTVRQNGMAAIAEAGLARFFTPDFIATNDINCQRVRNTLLSTDAEGYAGCCAAIRDMDLAPKLADITAPTLVVTGTLDQSTPPPFGEAIANGITGSAYVELRSAHIPCVEIP